MQYRANHARLGDAVESYLAALHIKGSEEEIKVWAACQRWPSPSILLTAPELGAELEFCPSPTRVGPVPIADRLTRFA